MGCACSTTFVILLLILILAYMIEMWVGFAPWTSSSAYTASPWWYCHHQLSNTIGWGCGGVGQSAGFVKACAAMMSLASIALFVALISACGVCCSCCRNSIPAIVMISSTGVAALMIFLSGCIWAGKGKPAGTSFGYGFVMAWLIFILLLIIVIWGAVVIKLKGDLVRYEPKVVAVVGGPGYNTGGGPGGYHGRAY